jgi:hypothetical protein
VCFFYFKSSHPLFRRVLLVALAQLLLAAFLDAQCSCGVSSKLNKIVGGEDAELHEFPWQVL